MPYKRVDLLLRVWERVRDAVGGRLIVVGDGPERAALEAAGAGVVFVGRVAEDEKWVLLGTSWALLHPAHHEGWGIVITEAAQVGTPSLGFNVPGVRDSIVDGVTGLLADSEEDLARRWIELAEKPELRKRLSEGARLHRRELRMARRRSEVLGHRRERHRFCYGTMSVTTLGTHRRTDRTVGSSADAEPGPCPDPLGRSTLVGLGALFLLVAFVQAPGSIRGTGCSRRESRRRRQSRRSPYLRARGSCRVRRGWPGARS